MSVDDHIISDVAVEGYLWRDTREFWDDLEYPTCIKDKFLQIHCGAAPWAGNRYLAKDLSARGRISLWLRR